MISVTLKYLKILGKQQTVRDFPEREKKVLENKSRLYLAISTVKR